MHLVSSTVEAMACCEKARGQWCRALDLFQDMRESQDMAIGQDKTIVKEEQKRKDSLTGCRNHVQSNQPLLSGRRSLRPNSFVEANVVSLGD